MSLDRTRAGIVLHDQHSVVLHHQHCRHRFDRRRGGVDGIGIGAGAKAGSHQVAHRRRQWDVAVGQPIEIHGADAVAFPDHSSAPEHRVDDGFRTPGHPKVVVQERPAIPAGPPSGDGDRGELATRAR